MWMKTVIGASSEQHAISWWRYDSSLLLVVMACFVFFAWVWPAAALSSGQGEEFRLRLAHDAELSQPQSMTPAFETFRLPIRRFLTPTWTTTFGRYHDPADVGYPEARFAVLDNLLGSEVVLTLTDLDFLYEADLGFIHPANASSYETAPGGLRPSAWVNYRYSDALHLRISRFMTPPIISIEDLASLALDLEQETPLPRLLTVMRLHGRFLLGEKSRDDLHYDVYAGGFATDSLDDLIAGIRVGYSFGLSRFSLGVQYRYGLRVTGLNLFKPSPVVDNGYPSSNDPRLFRISLRYDTDVLFPKNELYNRIHKGEYKPILVLTKPALLINEQWTVFYRFDQLRFGQKLPKVTEHAMGLKFSPIPHVKLHATLMSMHFGDSSTDAWGFRLGGIIKF
jgi:hypothetical protein